MASIAAARAFALASVSVINDAQRCRGRAIGLGILGGLAAGAIIGSAAAGAAEAPAPGRVAYPGYATLGAVRPASSPLNCGAATVDFGNDDDPNVVVSTYVAHDPGQWRIRHTLANGTVFDRSLQYAITDYAGPSAEQWRGTLNRNPNMAMVGEVRLNSTGQPTYNEWLYKDGQMIMHSVALCQYDRPVSTAAAPEQPPPPLSVIGGTRSNQTGKQIPLRLSGNSYIVPVLINGHIWRDFMIDTGASDVSIPADVATTLMRAGTITKEDIGGERNYVLADGATVKGTQFRIHSLQVGEGDNAVIAQNVDGSVSGPQGSLLLGQSFLRRFRSTTIDHVNSLLIIDGSEPRPPVPTALQPAPAPVPQPADPVSVQQGPILPPPEPQFRCNPPPVIRGLGAAFAILGAKPEGFKPVTAVHSSTAGKKVVWRDTTSRCSNGGRKCSAFRCSTSSEATDMPRLDDTPGRATAAGRGLRDVDG
jgi:predicted aspartyl protease